MINGVIFDMDGLMFDTERMWATFWKPALAALGLESPHPFLLFCGPRPHQHRPLSATGGGCCCCS